jgi:uncharacterized membrane protein
MSGHETSMTLPGSATATARGLWLVFLEVFVITPLAWSFNWDFSFVRMQVFWAIGGSMVVLAALVPVLPRRAVGVLGLLIVLGHNLWFAGVKQASRNPLLSYL